MTHRNRPWTPLLAVAISLVTTALAAAEPPLAGAPAQGANYRVVGAWHGVSGEGNAILATFHADGTVRTSVATEVSLDPNLLTLTSGHGVWKKVGPRRYEATVVGLLYDVPPEGAGAYRGYLRARLTLRLPRHDEDHLVGRDRVEIFDAEGNLLVEIPAAPTRYTRVAHAPFE